MPLEHQENGCRRTEAVILDDGRDWQLLAGCRPTALRRQRPKKQTIAGTVSDSKPRTYSTESRTNGESTPMAAQCAHTAISPIAIAAISLE